MTTPNNRKRRMRRRFRGWTKERSRIANAAKARKRMESPAPEPEPRMVKACRYQIKVRDTITGEVSDWVGLESARWAMRMAAALNERTDMKIEEWREQAQRETRGDMVWDILRDWSSDLCRLEIAIDKLRAALDKCNPQACGDCAPCIGGRPDQCAITPNEPLELPRTAAQPKGK